MVAAIMAVTLMALALFIARRDGADGVLKGLNGSWLALRGVILPMALGLTMAGMAQVALPTALVRQLLGDESGISGVAIGVLIGMLTPAGPYVVMPLAASLLSTGAGVGPISAFVTAWSVTPVTRTLVWELPFMGAAFTVSRVLVSLPFPFFVGFSMPYAYGLFS